MPLRGADSSNYEGRARYTSKMYIIIKGVKRGDADDEGIYLLAKDLAYNVALDQTSQLTEGIKQLTKKNMHDVSNAINILDPTSTIDGKICGGVSGASWVKSEYSGTGGKETQGKCWSGVTTTSSVDYTKLSDMFKESDTSKNNYAASKTTTMGEHTSAKISKDMSALNRDQKGIVSSAFAKAHEGAEIVDSLRESMERFVSLVKWETQLVVLVVVLLACIENT